MMQVCNYLHKNHECLIKIQLESLIIDRQLSAAEINRQTTELLGYCGFSGLFAWWNRRLHNSSDVIYMTMHIQHYE